MNELEIKLQEPFPEADIEWRIGQAGKKQDGTVWAKCLAYVTARAVQERLDQVFGTLGWRVRFDVSPTTNNVLCTIGVKDKNGPWVEKQDGSEPTDFEAFKGGLSGAFKRAAVHFGIGRYLYHLDVGWADIVDRGTAGAKFQPENEKKKIPQFYWLPPKLPKSALPGNSLLDSSKPDGDRASSDGGALKPKLNGPFNTLKAAMDRNMWSNESLKAYLGLRYKRTWNELSDAEKAELIKTVESMSAGLALEELKR